MGGTGWAAVKPVTEPEGFSADVATGIARP